MAAFVPGAGLPLSSSRTFVSGAAVNSVRQRRAESPLVSLPEISAIKLPKLPTLPKLPELPNPFQKKTAATPPPPPPEPVAEEASAEKTLSIGGKDVAVKEVVKASSDSYLKGGLPKFYNPSTSRAEFKATAKGHNSTAFDCRKQPNEPSTNEYANPREQFRNMDPYVDGIVWARPGWSPSEAEDMIKVIFKNIFGNAHLFESELAEMAYSISCVKRTGNIKEFVRAIAQSEAYYKRFYESSSNIRFIECNMLHFLGRAPWNQEEVSEHIQIINEQGYKADINSYIDSDEYDTLWGETRVPVFNFKGGHLYNSGMNKLAILRSGFARSDGVTKKAVMSTGDAINFSPFAITKGMPEAWRSENEARQEAGPVSEYGDVFWNPQPVNLRNAELEWIGRFGSWQKFWYKDSIVYKEIMTPNMKVTQEEKEEADAILKYGVLTAKNYIGVRKTFDRAPVIEMKAPTSPDVANGRLSVKMSEISFPIPSDLQQTV